MALIFVIAFIQFLRILVLVQSFSFSFSFAKITLDGSRYSLSPVNCDRVFRETKQRKSLEIYRIALSADYMGLTDCAVYSYAFISTQSLLFMAV